MAEKMKAVAVTGERKAEVIEMTKPAPGPEQILIKVKACALCTYEQRVYKNASKMSLPFVGGHEISGEIAEVGGGVDPEKYKIGSRAAARVIYRCGTCRYCRQGQENLCVETNRQLIGEEGISGLGGLGQFIPVDPSQVWILPDDMSFEKAALTEPVACVVNSFEKGKPELGDDVVIIGGGIMGMLHLMCAKARGARTIMSEPDMQRRKLAEELGCDITVDPMRTDPVREIKDLTEGRGADVVFNTTPISAVAEQAVQMTGKMGRCVMYSSQHPDVPIKVSADWLHNSEAIITGAVSPSIHSFDTAVRLLTKNIINPEKLISGVFDYTQADKAFEAAIRPDTYRIIIRF